MKTTLKTLSALAIAAATLTAVTLASGSAASANPFHGPGHGPVMLHGNGNLHAPGLAGRLAGRLKITCFACNLPRPHPTWGYRPWRFPHWGYYPWRYYGWGHRYNRWYWDRYHHRFGFEGRPGVVSLAAAPAAVSAPIRASAGPQNCLTEQKMPDGSVMFADVCKQISAIAPPPSADGRQ